jgi:site-specific DNA recombinase
MLRYFIYCRKSSETEDRQVLSIESQMSELNKLAERLNLKVIDIFSESQTAKCPGRPIFNEMIEKIKQNKADGIVCWKLDRLARNPIDGGQIIWTLQQGIIKHIQTYDRAYFPEDNVLLMSVEFGMANQFVLDLSKNVKRGLRTKAEKGWFPGPTPLGYLNDKTMEKGKKEIFKDPERFDLIKKGWELMITGRYTPPKILQIATEEWGLRTPHGRPLSRSTIYRLFTNPFYSGSFEYPSGSGNWYKGNHEPAVSQEEFDRVQVLLGRKGKPRIKRHNFFLTGLIRCGECGAMVTAEAKNQIICSKCKHKFSSNNRHECPKCDTPFEEMKTPTILRYVYYHCTKRINPDCTQRSIEVNELERQICQYLSKIHISKGFKDWATRHLKEESEREFHSRESIFSSQRKAYDNCLKKLDNLFQLKISPLNADGSLLSDEEFAKQKTKLLKEKIRLEEILNDTHGRVEGWLEVGEKTFNFACYAKDWFKKGSPQEKAAILQALGSNLILKGKKLFVEPKKPFVVIGQVVEGVPQVRPVFEPEKSGLNERKLEIFFSKNPLVLRGLDKVRTWALANLEPICIPQIEKGLAKAA